MDKPSQSNSYFADISKLLQIKFEVEEYRKLIEQFGENLLRAGTTDYLNRLPQYLIASCPFCHVPYIASFDTHSLMPNMFYPTNFRSLFRDDAKEHKCRHFVAVARFINLNGELPQEYARWHNSLGDVPVVVPILIKEDYEAAVIHSLPICRVEKDDFVPRYVVYITTYYSTSVDKTIKARRAELASLPNIDNDILTLLDGSFAAREEPIVKDLAHWVRIKKLYWLDLQTNELKTGALNNFPYDSIDGVGKSYHYIRKSRLPWNSWRYPNGYIT